MRILIDMNLSPEFVPLLKSQGHEATHWSAIGAHDADDRNIMSHAKAHNHVVLTNDQDFGALLALTGASGPSVIQSRITDVRPASLGPLVVAVLKQFEAELTSGALVTILRSKNKVRILPF